MKQRIITAFMILAVTIPVVLLSEYIIYPVAMSVLSLIASFEMLRVLGVHKKKSVFLPTYVMSFALPLRMLTSQRPSSLGNTTPLRGS